MMASGSDDRRAWWADPRYAILLVVLMAVPLWYPAIPPLTDLPGHMARYHIALERGGASGLKRWFDFRWGLMGNLGVDLLVMPLTRVWGVEIATKIVVMAIPMVTAAGLLLVAREVHGRLPPTAAFALPLAYGFPFQFGFVNYCLAMGLALCAFALWLRMGRGRGGWRAAIFVVFGLVIWFVHIFGWAVLGLMIAGAAFAASYADGGSLGRSACRSIIATIPLMPPAILMLMWRSGAVAGDTGDWFNWSAKLGWMIAVLRERWGLLDRVSAALLLFVVLTMGVRRKAGMVPTLAGAAVLLLAAYVVLPRILIGSAYADMRLAPYVLAVALIAIRPPQRHAGLLAGAALAFLLVRLTASTLAFAAIERGYDRQLAALDHLPRGARVFALVGTECQSDWAGNRMEHLPSMAVVGRDAFANDQWALPGAQLLSVRFPAAPRFTTDPGQIVRPAGCEAIGEAQWSNAIRDFPRDAFDYLWLIDVPGAARPRDAGLRSIWHGPTGALYRIARSDDAKRASGP